MSATTIALGWTLRFQSTSAGPSRPSVTIETVPASSRRLVAKRIGRSRKRAATERKQWPCPKSRVLPPSSRSSSISASTRLAICSGVSPPGQPSRNSSQSGCVCRICSVVRPSNSP